MIGIACYIGGLQIFHHAPLTTDEGSYVFQAVTFSEGKIARDAPPFGRLLQHRMIIQDPDVGWLSRYPPAHSIWLLPGVLADDPYLMVALAAALSAALLMLTARRLGATIEPVALLLLCSPYFLLMHGTLLSHTSGFLFTSLAIWGYVSWKSTEKLQWAMIAGLGLGLLALSRTYTALLIALPMGIDALVTLWQQRSRQSLMGLVLIVMTSLVGGILLLFYNFLAVGDPFTMTFLYYDPEEGLGFGLRSGDVEHSLQRGLAVLWDNIRLLDLRLLGWHGSLILGIILFFAGWTRTITPWLLLSVLAIPVGYILFWFEGIPETGPVYYFEMLPFLVLGAALGVSRLLERCSELGLRRPVFLLILLLALSAGSILHIVQVERELDSVFSGRRALRDTILSAPKGSIVFLPQMEDQPFLMLNAEGLHTIPLVAIQYKGEWVGLTRLFTEHRYFRLDSKPTPSLFPLTSPPPFKVHRDAKSFDQQPFQAHGNQGGAGDPSTSPGQRYSRPVWVPQGDFVVKFYFDTNGLAPHDKSNLAVEVKVPGTKNNSVRKEFRLKKGQDQVELHFSTDQIGMVDLVAEISNVAGVRFLGSSIGEI